MPPRQTDRWRWHVKVALASAIAGACRLEQHAHKAREQRRPLILGYHRVVEDFASASQTEMPSMLISRAMFERHVEWIGRSFRFVSLDEIGEQVSSGRPFADPVAAITFDDGYRDVYENAFPFLRRKGIPGRHVRRHRSHRPAGLADPRQAATTSSTRRSTPGTTQGAGSSS